MSAKTYYVAPSGGKDTNPGTLTQPWATWQKAFMTPVAGDTVFFRGGIWYPTSYYSNNFVVYLNKGNEGGQVVGHNGTASDPICYLAYPPDYEAGNFPILDCRYINPGNPGSGNQYYTQAIGIFGWGYLHIKGLTVRNLYQRYSNVMCQAIYGYGVNNMTWENMTVHNIGGRAMVSFQDMDYDKSHGIYSDTTRFINCDVYDLCDSLNPDPSYEFENPRTSYVAGLADGFKVQQTAGGYMEFDGCRIWHFSDDGIDFNATGLLVVRNCWIFRGGDFSFTNKDGTYGGEEGNGIKYGAYGFNTEKVCRIITNCISAYNNLGYDSNNSRTFYANLHSQVYNNTSYKNRIGFGNFSQNPTESYDERFFNNISYKDENYPRGDEEGDIIEGNNNWKSYTYAWNVAGIIPSYAERITIRDDDFQSLDETQLYLPRKIDGSLPDITFLKLASTSDAIDAGVNVGLPYYGAAPDLGYSEYVAGVVIPPSPSYVSSVIENATPSRLEMTYNLTLASIIPATSAFAVTVNSSTRNVSSVSISGTKVYLTLASPVVYGDVVKVAYTKPSTNPLQTSAGGQAVTSTAQNVINNCAANIPPTVSISSPTKSTSFTEPANITINAVATDQDGTITKVEFFNGSVKLGEITTAPYSFTWKNVTAGTYLITAAATDNQNARTVSIAVSLTVLKSNNATNQLPIVSISSPDKWKKFKKHDNIVLKATASDPDGTISKVEFKSGSTTLAELTSAPYIYVWKNVDTGTFVITAIATDNLGATVTSSEVELIIDDFYDVNSDIISLYPNPNDGHFSLDLVSSVPFDKNRVTIFNSTGQTVYSGMMTEEQLDMEMDISGSAPGFYIIMITSDNTIIATKKFIKR